MYYYCNTNIHIYFPNLKIENQSLHSLDGNHRVVSKSKGGELRPCIQVQGFIFKTQAGTITGLG